MPEEEYVPPRGERLEGKVAVVTGAGVERTGAGGSAAPADGTVAFIRENGGEAANYNSVADYAEVEETIPSSLPFDGSAAPFIPTD